MTIQQSHTMEPGRYPGLSAEWVIRAIRISLFAIALGLALWGGLQAYWLLRYPTLQAVTGDTVQLSRMALTLDGIGWIGHQHNPEEEENSVVMQPYDPTSSAPPVNTVSGGLAMPRSMMPGIPIEGQQRLRVEITLHNTSNEPQMIDPRTFRVEDADGQVFYALTNSTFRPQLLTSQQRIGAVLFIDVDEDAAKPTLIWTHQGGIVSVPLNGVEIHDSAH